LRKKIYNNIGILGGTFDPPHRGHVHISKIALKKFKLKKLLWIVTNQNPLKKKPYLNINERLKLCKKITKNSDKIVIKSNSSIVKNKTTFSLLKKIKYKNKKNNLFFLIGADNLINFHKWNNWYKIPMFAKIIVFTRPNYLKKAKNSVAAKKLNKNDWIYVPIKGINISSSLIRKFW